MAPKSSKKEKGGKKGGIDSGAIEQRLQAVVLSDTYQSRFLPLTLEKPRCLLPLANTPLIEYTLEFLALAGVDEVYVVCCAHADQIQAYLEQSKWKSPSSPFTIETVFSPESLSVGDAMRDLDNKGYINSDFLLVSGDIVSNIDFSKILAGHRARREKDRNAIMTMVLREASPHHRARARAEYGVFVFDEATNRCVHYEEVGDKLKTISIDPEIYSLHEALSIRNDLIDCHLDICTPDVPALFTENFDYDHMRKDFVHGILTSDLLGKTIYAHIEQECYAARVRSLQTYDAVSKDIVARWTYPICPDSNFLPDQTFAYSKGNIYKESSVVLEHGCLIGYSTVIGSHSCFGENSKIEASVIGRRCIIGRNVTIKGAYIWDDVVIEDDAVITRAIVASNAVISKGAKIEPGAVISYGVKIGRGRRISGNMKLSEVDAKRIRKHKNNLAITESDLEQSDETDTTDDDDIAVEQAVITSEENFKQPYHYNIVGDDGVGYVFDESSENEGGDYYSEFASKIGLVYDENPATVSDSSAWSSSEDEDGRGPGGNLKDHGRSKQHRKGRLSMSGVHRHRESITSSGGSRHRRTGSRSGKAGGTSSESEGEDGSGRRGSGGARGHLSGFQREALESLDRAITSNHDIDIAVLELNTLRMAMNADYHDVRTATVRALLDFIDQTLRSQASGNPKGAVNQVIGHWAPIFKRQVFDRNDETDLLIILQKDYATRVSEDAKKLLLYSVSVLYDKDIISEEAILEWWENKQANIDKKMADVAQLMPMYVEWLQAAEEDSEEDSDSE